MSPDQLDHFFMKVLSNHFAFLQIHYGQQSEISVDKVGY